MGVIYLVRHGQASFLQENYDKLSDLGIKQSQVLGEALRSRNAGFSKCCAGSLVRHRETAKSCLDAMIAAPTIDEDHRWNEYDHQELLLRHNSDFTNFQAVGDFVRQQQEPMKALQQLLNDAIKDWIHDRHDYSKSWLEFREGVLAALHQVAAGLEKEEKALVFTSGGPISVVLIHLLLLQEEQFVELQGRLTNTSISKVIVGKRKLSLGSYNEYGHLEHDQNLITFR